MKPLFSLKLKKEKYIYIYIFVKLWPDFLLILIFFKLFNAILKCANKLMHNNKKVTKRRNNNRTNLWILIKVELIVITRAPQISKLILWIAIAIIMIIVSMLTVKLQIYKASNIKIRQIYSKFNLMAKDNKAK